MRKKNSSMLVWGSAFLMLLLIYDAKTAMNGAAEGVSLCIRTVIPSLFPFFFLSGILNSFIAGRPIKLLRPLGKLCGVPEGAEYLLLIGSTGGYPIGAQCINSACQTGAISKNDAERMLAYCNNAGPSFIFGMTGLMFPSIAVPWSLWLIQILCALFTGLLLPGKSVIQCNAHIMSDMTPAKALRSALNAMASVCGWVVIFRIVIAVLERWVFWLLPAEYFTIISGLLELSNGCMALQTIEDTSVRFIIAAAITVFGGFCVGLQTISVCPGISCKMFFVGKLIQVLICIPLSMIVAGLLFPGNGHFISAGTVFAFCLMFLFFMTIKIKKHTGNSALYRV